MSDDTAVPDATVVEAIMRGLVDQNLWYEMPGDLIGQAIADIDEEVLTEFEKELEKKGIKPDDILRQNFVVFLAKQGANGDALFREYVVEHPFDAATPTEDK
jgi:hypothetical protein